MTQLEPIHTEPERAAEMPYAPAVEIREPSVMLFLSGATSSPLYHAHPHIPEEHVQPHDIGEQTRRALASIKSVLDARGMTWRNVVKITYYLTDMREAPEMHVAVREAFGDWRPASTMVCINSLSSPGARIELDMIAVGPLEAA